MFLSTKLKFIPNHLLPAYTTDQWTNDEAMQIIHLKQINVQKVLTPKNIVIRHIRDTFNMGVDWSSVLLE